MAQRSPTAPLFAADPIAFLIVIGFLPGALGEGTFLAGLAWGLGSFYSVSWVLALILLGIAVSALVFVVREVREGDLALRSRERWERVVYRSCAVVCLIILAVAFSFVFLPPIHRDVLIQHLAVPKLYLRHGGIFPLPFMTHSYYPMTIDMLFLVPLSLGWDSGSHIVSLFFGFVTAGLLFCFLKREIDPVAAIAGAVLFLSTPAVLSVLSSAYVDLALAFYVTSGIVAFFFFLRGLETRWLVLAGLSVGFGIATKYLGALVFVVLSLLLPFSLSRRTMPPGIMIRTLFAFCCFSVIPLVPWAARNFSWTGNPIHPLSGASIGGLGLPPLFMRQALYEESWMDLILLPFRLFLSGEEGNPKRFDGLLGPGILIFSLAGVTGTKRGAPHLLAAFVFLFAALNLSLLPVRARYFLPAVPVLSLLSSVGFRRLTGFPRFRAPVLFGFAGCLLFSGVHAWASFERLAPAPYLFGNESREQFLRSRLRDYRAISFVNRALPADARVYLLMNGDRGYYLDREYVYDPGQNAVGLVRAVRGAKGPADLIGWFRTQRMSHLLCQDELLDRYMRDNLSTVEFARWTESRDRLPILFRQDGFTVYAVPAAAHSAREG